LKIGYYHGLPEQGANLVEIFKQNEELKNPEGFNPNFESFNIRNVKIKLNQFVIYPLKQITINDTQITVSIPTQDDYCYQSPEGFDIYNLALDFQLDSEHDESIDVLYYFD
jgi:hypothetical protein